MEGYASQRLFLTSEQSSASLHLHNLHVAAQFSCTEGKISHNFGVISEQLEVSLHIADENVSEILIIVIDNCFNDIDN